MARKKKRLEDIQVFKPYASFSIARLPIRRGPHGSNIRSGVNYPSREEMPATWPGSYPEFLVDWVLSTVLKYKRDLDYTYQKSALGGRVFSGGVVLDFVITRDYPSIGIVVQGIYWHYIRKSLQQIQQELANLRRLQIELQWDIILLDEDQIYANPIAVVRDAVERRRSASRTRI